MPPPAVIDTAAAAANSTAAATSITSNIQKLHTHAIFVGNIFAPRIHAMILSCCHVRPANIPGAVAVEIEINSYPSHCVCPSCSVAGCIDFHDKMLTAALATGTAAAVVDTAAAPGSTTAATTSVNHGELDREIRHLQNLRRGTHSRRRRGRSHRQQQSIHAGLHCADDAG
jgi:hypothetical protein